MLAVLQAHEASREDVRASQKRKLLCTYCSFIIHLVYRLKLTMFTCKAKYFHWMCLGVLVNTHSEESLLEFKCSSSMNSTGRVN